MKLEEFVRKKIVIEQILVGYNVKKALPAIKSLKNELEKTYPDVRDFNNYKGEIDTIQSLVDKLRDLYALAARTYESNLKHKITTTFEEI